MPDYDQVLSLNDMSELNMIKDSIKQTCLKMHNMLGRQHSFSAKSSGVVITGFVLVGMTHMLTFNIGDSRTLMIDPENVKALTTDHDLQEPEEIDRIAIHIQETRSALKLKEPIGRRLDFLMQELLREANTLGSKSAHVDSTGYAIELKVLIEQIKEQIQNVE